MRERRSPNDRREQFCPITEMFASLDRRCNDERRKLNRVKIKLVITRFWFKMTLLALVVSWVAFASKWV